MLVTHEIVSNPATMTITVGPKVFDKPVLVRIPESWTAIKRDIVEPDMDLWKPQDLNRFYCRHLGPKFNRRFQAANYYLWIAGRMTERTANMLRCDGRHWRNYSDDLVWRANQALPYVNEAERDNLYNLIPLIVSFCQTPQAIKRRVGQGAWRRLAANSVSRNLKIMHAVERFRPCTRYTGDGDTVAAHICRLLDVPSGVLRGIYTGDDDEFIAARITHKKRVDDFIHTKNLVQDTRRMTGRRFNPNWGLTRMIAEHNAAAREENRKGYSDKRFADDWTMEADGYTAALLTSPLDIAVEGQTQHHCVASYAGLARRGDYAVFRIVGKDRATLGVKIDGSQARLDQVYGACNQPVPDACLAFSYLVAGEYAASMRRAAQMPRAVEEWIGKTDDHRAPGKVRQRVFDRDGGICHLCRQAIQIGQKYDLDHVEALINGGENRESNLKPAHRKCHVEKTASDVAEKAKIAAIRGKHIGAVRPSSKLATRDKPKQPKESQKLDFTKRRNPFTHEAIS